MQKYALCQGAIAVYESIERHYCEDGHSPSSITISQDTGFVKSTIFYHLNRLERAGWIKRNKSRQHAFVPIRQPRTYWVHDRDV